MAAIEMLGLESLQRMISRSTAGALQADLVDNLHTQATAIRSDMEAATFTRIQRRAMDSVSIDSVSDGIEINGGKGGGLGAVLFPGGEFGGKKSAKVSYPTHSPLGRPYRVSRKTTMQFQPHLGSEGYFFYPTIREWLPRLIEQSNKIIAEDLGKAA